MAERERIPRRPRPRLPGDQPPAPVNQMIDSKHILMALLGLASAAAGRAVPVEVVRDGDGFALLRGGEPYFVRGVGIHATQQIDLLAAAGGNSVRTWGVDDGTLAQLDAAHALGMTVTVGVWLEHRSAGADYADEALKAKQRERVRDAVARFKDHPAVLMWGISNETEAGSNTEGLLAAPERPGADRQGDRPAPPRDDGDGRDRRPRRWAAGVRGEAGRARAGGRRLGHQQLPRHVHPARAAGPAGRGPTVARVRVGPARALGVAADGVGRAGRAVERGEGGADGLRLREGHRRQPGLPGRLRLPLERAAGGDAHLVRAADRPGRADGDGRRPLAALDRCVAGGPGADGPGHRDARRPGAGAAGGAGAGRRAGVRPGGRGGGVDVAPADRPPRPARRAAGGVRERGPVRRGGRPRTCSPTRRRRRRGSRPRRTPGRTGCSCSPATPAAALRRRTCRSSSTPRRTPTAGPRRPGRRCPWCRWWTRRRGRCRTRTRGSRGSVRP